MILTPTLSSAQQLPTGGSVAAGSVTIASPNAGTLNVNQSTDRAVINWSNFSVGAGGTVNFNQPGASSATLNRVTGSTPSTIAGTINAPGTVLLVNPNGITITKSGIVNVGSFAASTLDIKDNDFMSGNYRFTGNGASAGVTNAGRINVADGGFAALLGGQVANDGVISARLGKVGLGSGELMTLDLAGDGFLSVAVPTLNGIVGADGKPLVSNKGKIRADGGVVYLSAATAAGLLRDAVHVPGSIRANSVGTRDGRIVIGGGAGGKVTVSGKVKANGNATAKGGKIDISGAQVAVSGKVRANGAEGGTVEVTGTEKADIAGDVSAKGESGKGGTVIVSADAITVGGAAKLDVSGAQGGLLLIGGDYQGGGNAANNFAIEPVKAALTTTIAAGARLNAAGTNGDGGKIVVWSDDVTQFAGHVDVGSMGGAGGFAEVSGHRLLDFTGTANLAGTNGAGTLLLDPRNVTISNGGNQNSSNAGGTFTPGADNSIINVATLQAALASGNVIVTTGGAGSAGSQAGDITVANDVTWSANTLTLQAYRSIIVNGNLTATGTAGLTLTTNNGGTGGTLTFGGKATFASTSQSLVINGTSYTLIDSMSGLQNINSNLTGNYALIASLDASGVSNWIPIGTDGAGAITNGDSEAGGFKGRFTGLGNTISNLTINMPGVNYVGLFGAAGSGSLISGLNLSGINYTANSSLGGIVGKSSGSVSDINVSGTLVGSAGNVGGIVGYAYIGSTIADAHVNASVSGVNNIGGVVGSFVGISLSDVAAAGSVSASGLYAGGLAGAFGGPGSTLANSYSTAAVSAQRAGGLFGSLSNGDATTVSNAWSSGLISGLVQSGGIAGAVAGNPTYSNVYWDTGSTGQAYAHGGSTSAIAGTAGLTTAQARTQSSYPGFDFANTWYMVDGDTRPFLRSEFSTTIGNAHQLQLIGMNRDTLSGSYSLSNNLNLGATLSNASEMWGSKGWVPIGTAALAFNGSFDGNYYIIDGLKIGRPTQNHVGLFGYTYDARLSRVGLTNVDVKGQDLVGSLAGQFYGVATDSFATGAVSGRWQVGGLLGETDNPTFSTAGNTRLYANVSVFGTGGDIGGLIGQNNSILSQAYSAGYVTAGVGSVGVGAVFGAGDGTVSNVYYDTLTAGNSGAGTGYVTAQMQSALGGFDSNWSVVTGKSYFYLTGFYPTAPHVISGTAFSDAGNTAAAGAKVGALINGVYVGSAYAGANGYYNVVLPSGSIAANSQIATYTTGANAGVTYLQDASGSQLGMIILGGWLSQTSSAASMSAISSGLATAIGSSGVSTALANRDIIARNSSFTLDEALTQSGILRINSGGTVTQNAGASITANDLRLGQISGGGASFTLLDAGNSFARLGMSTLGTGSLNLYTSAALSIAAVTANGGLVIRTAGNLTLSNVVSSTAVGDAVVLSAGGTFTNIGTSTAITTPNGRWIVYAGTPSGSSFNNLNSNNAAVFNATYANNAPSTIAAGNRYVFALQPTLTFTSTSASKYYGQTADISSNYTVSANVASVPNAFTVDTGAYSGTPTLTSAGTAATATVAGGPYAVNIAQGSLTSNFALAFANSGMLTVNKATLIVYGASASKTYGQTYASTTDFTTSGLLNGDTVTSVSLASTGAAASADAGSYTLTASNAVGTGLSNYNVLYAAGTLQVGKAILTINAANASKVYGSTAAFAGTEFTVSGLVNGDAVSSVSLTSTGAAGTANVGSYQIVAGNAAGAKISNYIVFYNNGSLSVTPAPLTVTANDQSKVYGTAHNLGTTAFSITNGSLLNSDTLTGVTLSSGAAAATAAVGFQSIIPSNATGTGLSNYSISYSAAGKLTVTPAPLTITANDQSKAYGQVLGSNGAYSVTGGTLFNGDTLTGVTLASAGFAGSASVAGGPYAINASNAQGTGLYNYTITYAPGTLTVAKANLTVTAGNQSKNYGDALNLGTNGFTNSSLFNGDTLTGVTLASTGAAATGSAGTHAIVASDAQGSGLANYNITYVDGSLNVSKATLIVYVGTASKSYGETSSLTNQYSVSGLKNSDGVTSVDLTSAGAAATASVGNYALNGSNAQGTGLGNYTISYQPGTLYVSPATLTIIASNASKVYGTTHTFAGTEFTATGLVNGDTISSVGLASAGAAAGANVGSYQIVASNATGSALSNYAIYYNNGSMNVTAAPLTVTANDRTKTYGTAFNLGTTEFSITGGSLFNSDTLTGVTLSSGAAAATAAAGGQTIYVSNAIGTGLSNYAITYATTGRLTVNPAPLTVTVNDRTKTYGQVLGLGSTGYTVTGDLFNGDTLTGVTLASAGAAGTAQVSGSPYVITGSNATGTGLYNYAITYVAGALTVTPANITVTANNQSKTYGDALGLGTTGYLVTGSMFNGDSVTGVTLTSAGAAATATVAGGPYAITAGNAQGSGLGNYTITYADGSLTVNKASLIVYAGTRSKGYGTTYSSTTDFTVSGLKNSDNVTAVTLASAGAAAAANVGNYVLTASDAQGTGLGNYTVSYQAGSLNVSPAILTINAANGTKVYGTTGSSSGTEFNATGLVNGDSIGSVQLTSAGAAATANVGSYWINASNATGTGLSNYLIYYNQGSLSVTPAPLTISAGNQSKVYGSTAGLGSTAFSVTSGALVNGDAITGVTLTSPGGAPATANVAGYSLFASAATGSGVSNYNITYVPGTLQVTPAPLTVTANDRSKTYGDVLTLGNAGFTTTGTLFNGDTITGVTLASAGAAANAGVSGGPYAIGASNAQGSGVSNYAITYVSGALTVNRANLTVTANDATKGYGQTVAFNGTEFTSSGLRNGETIGSVALSSAGAAAGANVNGSPYAIVASTASGGTFNSGNYNITYVDGALTVTPAALTVAITPNAASKVYGDALNFAGTEFSQTGLVNGDTISGVTLTSAGAVATAGVGQYDIVSSNAVFGVGSALNYNIVYNVLAGGLTVTARPLIITANSASRVYGDANPATGTATGNNLVNGDTIAGVTLNTPATAASGVGSYGLTGSAATGTGLSNYAITYATVANGLTVTPRALVITANNVSRVYGDANPASGTATGDNLVNGDTITSVTLNTPATTGSGVGSYALTGSAATGTGLGNYTITYATVANGLTITPRALVITANNVSRIYGDANLSSGTAIGDSLVNGDTITGVTLNTPATAASGVGTYALTGSAATGTGLGNYTITYATVANGLSVTPRALVVTANNVSRIYGDANPASGTATGDNLVNGDSITGVNLSSPATAASGVGSYGLTGSNATGTGLSNYTITYATVANGLTVTPRALMITANTVSRVYGDANPGAGTATGDNLVNGDTITGVSLSSPATVASGVGSYALTGSNATGTGLSNYTITYATVANGLTVTPRALTVTADAQSKLVGEADPLLSYRITFGNLVNADTLTGALTRDPGETEGVYAILQGSLAASANYSLSYVGADLTIAVPPPTPAGNGDYATSWYNPALPAGGAPVVNISFQPNAPGAPVISVVNAPRVAANPPAGTNVAAGDPSQNIAPAGGPLDLFVPISQFDRMQYVTDTLPGFAPEAGKATVLAMIARAGLNNRTEPKIDALWSNGGAAWPDANGPIGKAAQFGDGNGASRQPAGDNGFAFVNGTTDMAAMLKSGPVMLGGAKADGTATPWLLALQMTADGKGIIANDPATGRQVVLAYDAATKTVGAVAGMVDPATRQIAPLADTAPAGIAAPPAAWNALKAFKVVSYFAVTL